MQLAVSRMKLIEQEMKDVTEKLSCLPVATTEAETRQRIELQNEQIKLQNEWLILHLERGQQWKQYRETRNRELEERLSLFVRINRAFAAIYKGKEAGKDD